MARKLDSRLIDNLKAPSEGNVIEYDTEVKGFGCRITAAGTRSFILNYRNRAGRERRYTIGKHPEWSASAARKKAKDLKRQIKDGADPQGTIQLERGAPTVGNMCDRFIEEHLTKLRPNTIKHYKAIIARLIRPELGSLKVAAVTFSDVDDLHRKFSKKGIRKKGGAPYQANRAVSVLSKMFNLAIRWGWRADNPAKGVERAQEDRRERYLTHDELERLKTALSKDPDQQGANIVRMLIFTGARSGEVRSMRWDQIKGGIWTKPASTTKQKKSHSVPLSAPALQLLMDIEAKKKSESEHQEKKKPESEYVFPGRSKGYRADVKKIWERMRKAAKIKDARLHDLRHTYASIIASSGGSLLIIGGLLGHSQPATTARYAHLFNDPLKEATERVGAIFTGDNSAEVVDHPKQVRRP